MQFRLFKMSPSRRFSPTAVILFLMTVVISVLTCTTRTSAKLPLNETIPALLVFGDSIVDAGNNNYLNTIVKCNFPPYGRDFGGGIPTGRFCDGRVPSDMIAEELGIKETLPAYLDPTLRPQDPLTGVTFASGGTGYDPLTPALVSVISLPDQLEYFKQYIAKVKAIVGEERANFITSRSLYLVVAGNNDIATTYFTLRARREYDIPSYTDLMANNAAKFLEELYRTGARRISVFSVIPVGCVPAHRTLDGGPTRRCADNFNQEAVLFNSKLSQLLDSLNSKLPNSNFIYVDFYTPLLDLIQNGNKYGFSVADRGCCGTGNLEEGVLCNPLTPVTCPNVADYVFWDSSHPTESAYRILISKLLAKYAHKLI